MSGRKAVVLGVAGLVLLVGLMLFRTGLREQPLSQPPQEDRGVHPVAQPVKHAAPQKLEGKEPRAEDKRAGDKPNVSQPSVGKKSDTLKGWSVKLASTRSSVRREAFRHIATGYVLDGATPKVTRDRGVDALIRALRQERDSKTKQTFVALLGHTVDDERVFIALVAELQVENSQEIVRAILSILYRTLEGTDRTQRLLEVVELRLRGALLPKTEGEFRDYAARLKELLARTED